jgi:hypothetical protein
LPQQWKESIIVPIYKKGDKTDCNNYWGICLLSSAYRILSNILLARLTPYLRFPNCWLFLEWGRQPYAQPPTWRTMSPYLYLLETGWPSYTPRHTEYPF